MVDNKKILKAVAPYNHIGYLNFKRAPFEAWKRNGGIVTKSHYPPRFLHGIVFRLEMPTIYIHKKEVRLKFVEPVSLFFDTFPDYLNYEIVPMFWDCWPCYFKKTCEWIEKHKVRTVIFTSRQVTNSMRKVFPEINIIWCAEAVDNTGYDKGSLLKDRKIDLLEFGRSNDRIITAEKLANVTINGKALKHICTKQNGKFIYDNEQLHEIMGKAKVTIALPRSMTQPEIAGNIETLTQRYWECMYSRIVMVGHAPHELIDFIGYNPVIEMRDDIPSEELIIGVLENIEDYQKLVDKNWETAIRLGSWDVRMKWLMKELANYYKI